MCHPVSLLVYCKRSCRRDALPCQNSTTSGTTTYPPQLSGRGISSASSQYFCTTAAFIRIVLTCSHITGAIPWHVFMLYTTHLALYTCLHTNTAYVSTWSASWQRLDHMYKFCSMQIQDWTTSNAVPTATSTNSSPAQGYAVSAQALVFHLSGLTIDD